VALKSSGMDVTGLAFAVCRLSIWKQHRLAAQVTRVPGFEADEQTRRVARRTQMRGKRTTAAQELI